MKHPPLSTIGNSCRSPGMEHWRCNIRCGRARSTGAERSDPPGVDNRGPRGKEIRVFRVVRGQKSLRRTQRQIFILQPADAAELYQCILVFFERVRFQPGERFWNRLSVAAAQNKDFAACACLEVGRFCTSCGRCDVADQTNGPMENFFGGTPLLSTTVAGRARGTHGRDEVD